MKDYMILPIEIKNIEKKAENGKEYYFIDGFASVYNNIDLGGDRVLPSFFIDDLKENGNKRKALWQHDRKEPLGINIYTNTDSGLMFRAQLPADDIMVSGRLIPQLEMGTIEGASIGYSVIESKYNTEKGCRDLVKGQLYESSFVSEPMNPKCVIYSISKLQKSIKDNNQQDESLKYMIETLVKNYEINTDIKEVSGKLLPIAGENISWDKNKAVKQIRQFTNSSDKPSETYKNGFMYYDKENAESFGAYKLPFVYIIDDKMMAIPKALSAITGAIAGARGGLDIPEVDKSNIKTIINKYYDSMGRETPFKSDGKTLIDKATIKYLEMRDYEKIFDDDIIISHESKKYIASMLFVEETADNIDDSKENIKHLESLLKIIKEK